MDGVAASGDEASSMSFPLELLISIVDDAMELYSAAAAGTFRCSADYST